MTNKDLHTSSISTHRAFLPYILISLIVSVVYLPTFTGSFILDDNPLIRNNRYIREAQPVYSHLAREDGITDSQETKDSHTGYYRPLTSLSYWLDCRLWGMTPEGFRATNLILHLLTCFLLFRFLLFLVNDRQAAFWVTLLYAIHPVNTGSVSWVSARNNILVTLLVLSSVHCYLKRWEGAISLSFIASVLFFAMAVLSKEFGLLVLPCIFFYNRFLSVKRRDISQELISYLPFILVLTAYFLLRKLVTGAWLTPSDAADFWKRVYFATYLVAWNLKLVFAPYGLHSFIVGYPADYLNWQAIASFCGMALLGLILWQTRKNKLLTFSVFSFLVALLPILNIIPTSAVTLISTRWLYLPMIFLCLAATPFIGRSLKRNRFLTISILIPVLVYAGTYSFILNKYLWHDEDAFFRQEVFHFNNYFYAGGLAENLFNSKDYQQAERYFKMAIKHYPGEAGNYINYSALLTETGRPEAAIALLEQAKSLSMNRKKRGEWHNNIGTAYFHLRKHTEALEHYRKAIVFLPDESQFWANIGATYGEMGDYDNCVSALNKGLSITPDSVQLRKNLAVAYRRIGDHAKAVREQSNSVSKD
ncbi:MAG: tetratricopeptide repeat protein [Desulfobacteraceae bacterium]|nr:tetratricopeptide repeat protein [Desulfobacteraceae bacterium]